MQLRVLLVAAVWVCGGCLLSTAVHAEPDAPTFLKHYDEADLATKKSLERWISDIQNGMSWANAELLDRSQPPLYCPPDSLVLTGQQLVDILRREVTWREVTTPGVVAKVAFPAVLLLALEKSFSLPFAIKKGPSFGTAPAQKLKLNLWRVEQAALAAPRLGLSAA